MLVDVVVVGAGPAGSVTAWEVAKRGFSVLLLEKDAFPGQTNVCAGGVEQWVVDEFALGEGRGEGGGIVEKEIFSRKFYFPWGAEEYEANSATVRRENFDSFLARSAEDAGAQLLTNTVACGVTRSRGGSCVRVAVKERGREAEGIVKIETKILVFADGPNTLARRFGIGFEVRPDTVAESAIFEIDWKSNPLDRFEFFLSSEISPWGYGWIFPKRNSVNIGVWCLYSKLQRNIYEYLKDFKDFLAARQPPFHEKRIARFSSALIPLVPAKRIYEERMLVVGDAAGMVDPFFGGGICYAIRGGRIAGQSALDALEEGIFSRDFLSAYQKEWERTGDYINIKKMYHLSNVFLPLSKIDKNIFGKMIGTGLNKRGVVRKSICLRK